VWLVAHDTSFCCWVRRWFLAVQLREPERPTEDSERRMDRLQARRRGRRRWALQGLLVFLAVLSAWLVVLFVGSPVEESTEEAANVARSVVAEERPDEPPSESSDSEEGTEEASSFDAEALEDELEGIVGEYEGVYGISVLEPDSGTGVSLRGDEEFVAASIGKLPPFAALYAAAARGELDLEEEISMRAEDVQSYGSGSLHGFPVGHSLSLRECAYRLVNHSDNTAWVMLDRRLGKEEIGAELQRMGIEDSSYLGHSSGYYTTPDDVMLLLEKISDPRFTDEELSVEMLEAMTDTSVEDRIPEKLPEDVRVAHKTGSYEGNFGDAGVVFYKDSQGKERRYYLTVLSEGAGEPEAREVIQKVSLAVYQAISGNTVDSEWSRGSVSQEESAPAASPQPVPENTARTAESTQPAKSPPPPPEKSPDSRSSAAPARSAQQAPAAAPRSSASPPSYPAAREPAYPRPSAPVYSWDEYWEEPTYWEAAYPEE
jgi:beta-lactamase class A